MLIAWCMLCLLHRCPLPTRFNPIIEQTGGRSVGDARNLHAGRHVRAVRAGRAAAPPAGQGSADAAHTVDGADSLQADPDGLSIDPTEVNRLLVFFVLSLHPPRSDAGP